MRPQSVNATILTIRVVAICCLIASPVAFVANFLLGGSLSLGDGFVLLVVGVALLALAAITHLLLSISASVAGRKA